MTVSCAVSKTKANWNDFDAWSVEICWFRESCAEKSIDSLIAWAVMPGPAEPEQAVGQKLKDSADRQDLSYPQDRQNPQGCQSGWVSTGLRAMKLKMRFFRLTITFQGRGGLWRDLSWFASVQDCQASLHCYVFCPHICMYLLPGQGRQRSHSRRCDCILHIEKRSRGCECSSDSALVSISSRLQFLLNMVC